MNRGAKQLAAALEEHGAKAALAREMGVGADIVSRWLSGERRPDTKQRAHLEDSRGIGWRLWDEDLAEENSNGDAA